jgi:hypothetical protein
MKKLKVTIANIFRLLAVVANAGKNNLCGD